MGTKKEKFNKDAAKKMEAWKKKMAAYKKTQAYKDFQAKKKAKKFKKPKDPNAPKRPLNAYFLFSNANRSKIQKSLGTEDFGTVAKEIKKQWDSLSETEKNKFQSEKKAAFKKDKKIVKRKK